MRNGLQVSRPARALIDSAGREDLEVVVDAALRLRIVTPRTLLTEASRPEFAKRGIAVLRELARDRLGEGRSESELEDRMVRLLRAHALPQPTRQFEARLGGRDVRFDSCLPGPPPRHRARWVGAPLRTGPLAARLRPSQRSGAGGLADARVHVAGRHRPTVARRVVPGRCARSSSAALDRSEVTSAGSASSPSDERWATSVDHQSQVPTVTGSQLRGRRDGQSAHRSTRSASVSRSSPRADPA